LEEKKQRKQALPGSKFRSRSSVLVPKLMAWEKWIGIWKLANYPRWLSTF